MPKAKPLKPLIFETFKGGGAHPWYFRVKSSNGKVIIPSEGYSRPYNRTRAVKRLAAQFKVTPIIREAK